VLCHHNLQTKVTPPLGIPDLPMRCNKIVLILTYYHIIHRYKHRMERKGVTNTVWLVSIVGHEADVCATNQDKGRFGISRTWLWLVNITGSGHRWPAVHMPYHSLTNHCVPFRHWHYLAWPSRRTDVMLSPANILFIDYISSVLPSIKLLWYDIATLLVLRQIIHQTTHHDWGSHRKTSGQ